MATKLGRALATGKKTLKSSPAAWQNLLMINFAFAILIVRKL